MTEHIQAHHDWIGDKPKTRIKEINFGALPNAAIKDVQHDLTPLQYANIVNISAIAEDIAANKYPLPVGSLTIPENSVSFSITPLVIRITTGINRSSWTAKVFVEYRV